jgi:hypothetical protein
VRYCNRWLVTPSAVDSGFLGVVVVAFSPHLFVWKRTDISLLGVNFACGRKLDLTICIQGKRRCSLLTTNLVRASQVLNVIFL